MALAACNTSTATPAPKPTAFPAAARPVADIVSPRWSDEDSRDKAGESIEVMDRAGVTPGMTVADINAPGNPTSKPSQIPRRHHVSYACGLRRH